MRRLTVAAVVVMSVACSGQPAPKCPEIVCGCVVPAGRTIQYKLEYQRVDVDGDIIACEVGYFTSPDGSWSCDCALAGVDGGEG